MALTIDQLVAQQRAKINDLQAQRKVHSDVIQRIKDATMRDDRDPTVAEAAEVRAAVPARDRIDAQIEPEQRKLDEYVIEQRVQQRVDEMQHRTGSVLVDGPDGSAVRQYAGAPGEFRVGGATSSPRANSTTGSSIVRLHDGRPAVVERAQRFNDHPVVADFAAQRSRSERPVMDTHGGLGNMVRAMSTTGGSAIVPTLWAGDIIDRARNAAAVLQAGAQIVPMDSKTLQVGRLITDPTAGFRAEGSAITASDPAFDNVTLTAKTLSCLVVGSLEFFMDAVDADQVVQDAVGNAMGLELDKQALFGGLTTGAEVGATGFNTTFPSPPNPTGILQSLITAGFNVLGNATHGTVQTAGSFWSEIVATVLQPTLYNETPNALIWPAALALKYGNAYDTTGQPLRRPSSLDSVQTYVSNQIPINMTQGSTNGTLNMTDVFAGDFTKLLIGQRLDLQIQVLTERYAELGQIGILATWRGDVALARPRAFSAYRFIKNT